MGEKSLLVFFEENLLLNVVSFAIAQKPKWDFFKPTSCKTGIPPVFNFNNKNINFTFLTFF